MSIATTTPVVTDKTVLRFARGNRLQYDRVREQWFIQAPERAFIADPNAAEVLQLIDGKRSLNIIADKLHQKFMAPRDIIIRDTIRLTQELADKQVLAVV